MADLSTASITQLETDSLHGDKYASYELGLRYKRGADGVNKSYSVALDYFLKASENGHVEATYEAGLCYNNSSCPEIYNTYKSFAMYKKASDMGHVEAIHMLGLSYILGLGVEKDINKAMSLVQKAADLGSLEATCFLGDAYYYGKSVTKNYQKAFELYQKAHEGGFILGTTKMGVCYSEGNGVLLDDNMAVDLFKKAAKAGDYTAKLMLQMTKYKDFPGVNAEPLTEAQFKRTSVVHQAVLNVKERQFIQEVYEHVVNCDESFASVSKFRDYLDHLKRINRISEANKPNRAGEYGLVCSSAVYTCYFISKKKSKPATLAHYAACRGRVDLLAILFEFDIELNQGCLDTTNTTVSPLDVARMNKRWEAVTFLENPHKPTRSSVNSCIIS